MAASTNGRTRGRNPRGYGGIVTPDYRSRPVWRDWDLSAGEFNVRDVDVMRFDSQVAFLLRVIYAPLPDVKWGVEAKSPEVGQWVKGTLDRVWERELAKLFLHVVYGWMAAEIAWDVDEEAGTVAFGGFADFHPFDVTPLQQGGKLAGIAIRNVEIEGQDKPWLVPPRSFYLANEPEFRQLWGRSRLRACWEPWKEKAARHGAREIRRMWFLRNAYRSGYLRHPGGSIEISPNEWVSCVDYAREIAEKAETGHILTLPTDRDEDGNFLWEWQEPVNNGDIPGVHEYIDRLDRDIFRGGGVPLEIVEAAETGSGWSGRNLPFLSFLKGEDAIVDAIGQGVKEQVLDRGVSANFGPEAIKQYKIKAKSLVPEDEKEGDGKAGGGDAGAQSGLAGDVPEAMPGGKPATPQQPQQAAQPVQMSQDANPWQPYEGPRGGKGWKNTSTGGVRYGGDRPGADDAGEQEEGGAKPAPKKHGPSKAYVRRVGDEKKAEKAGRDMLGKAFTLETAASLAGAPDDATVTVTPEKGGGLRVQIDHPAFAQPAIRRIVPQGKGVPPIMINEIIDVRESHRGKGLGTDIFARQVEQAAEAGVSAIHCHAAKLNDKGEPYFNGYYTWPLLGYNAFFEDLAEESHEGRAAAERAKKAFPQAECLLDIVSTREGQQWWKANGCDIHDAKFSLKAGSGSMRQMEGYLAARAARAQMSQDAGGLAGMEDFSPEEIAAAEAAAIAGAGETQAALAGEKAARRKGPDGSPAVPPAQMSQDAPDDSEDYQHWLEGTLALLREAGMGDEADALEEELTPDAPVQMAMGGAQRAPKGGISFNGRQYRGGQFIPAKEVESASPADKAKLAAAKEASDAGRKTRDEARAARGDVDAAGLAGRLKKHADTHGELATWERRQAAASARMIARHHGAMALHRIDELAGLLEKAHAATDDPDLQGRLSRRLAMLHQSAEAVRASGVEGKVPEEMKAKPAEAAPPTDALQVGRGNLRSAWEAMRDELVMHDPKLSPNRAGELAAARLRNQMGNRLADIDARARTGNITPEEERFYDEVNVNDWEFGRELEMMSGNRTMAADMDNAYVQRPLDAGPLEDRATPQREKAQEQRANAVEVDARRAKAAKDKAETNKKGREEFEQKQRETTAREILRARVARNVEAGKAVPDADLAKAGFTGTDVQGREWRDGELVAKGVEGASPVSFPPKSGASPLAQDGEGQADPYAVTDTPEPLRWAGKYTVGDKQFSSKKEATKYAKAKKEEASQPKMVAEPSPTDASKRPRNVFDEWSDSSGEWEAVAKKKRDEIADRAAQRIANEHGLTAEEAKKASSDALLAFSRDSSNSPLAEHEARAAQAIIAAREQPQPPATPAPPADAPAAKPTAPFARSYTPGDNTEANYRAAEAALAKEPPPAAKDFAILPPAEQDREVGRAAKILEEAFSRLGGVVKVHDVADAIQSRFPGASPDDVRATLERMQATDQLTLQVADNVQGEPRVGEMYQSPRGVRGYVSLRPGVGEAQAAPAPPQAAPEPDAPAPVATPAPAAAGGARAVADGYARAGFMSDAELDAAAEQVQSLSAAEAAEAYQAITGLPPKKGMSETAMKQAIVERHRSRAGAHRRSKLI